MQYAECIVLDEDGVAEVTGFHGSLEEGKIFGPVGTG
jgi:hypothetical protein